MQGATSSYVPREYNWRLFHASHEQYAYGSSFCTSYVPGNSCKMTWTTVKKYSYAWAKPMTGVFPLLLGLGLARWGISRIMTIGPRLVRHIIFCIYIYLESPFYLCHATIARSGRCEHRDMRLSRTENTLYWSLCSGLLSQTSRTFIFVWNWAALKFFDKRLKISFSS